MIIILQDIFMIHDVSRFGNMEKDRGIHLYTSLKTVRISKIFKT